VDVQFYKAPDSVALRNRANFKPLEWCHPASAAGTAVDFKIQKAPEFLNNHY
jgi:hypothetical protein